MRALRNQQRVQAPDSDFPFGRIKDTTPTERGTPVKENVVGDQFQFFEKLMAVAEIESNELPECGYTGFQLFQALLKTSFKYNAAPIVRSMIGNYTANDVVILFGVDVTLSNSDNTSTWTDGAIFYNDQVFLVPAGTDTKSSGIFLYSIDDEDDYLATITHGDSGDGIADYGAPEVKRKSYTELPGNAGTYISIDNKSVHVSVGVDSGNKTNGQTLFTIPSKFRTAQARFIYIALVTYQSEGGSSQEGHCIPAFLNTQTGVCSAAMDMATGHNIVWGCFSYLLD
jgi:hypothetical protein